MSYRDICPLCGGIECKRSNIQTTKEYDAAGFLLNCQLGYNCIIYWEIYNIENCNEVKRRFHMIYSFLLKNGIYKSPDMTQRYRFYFQDDLTQNIELPYMINVAKLMINYPENFMDKMDLALINLGKKYSKYGQVIHSGYEVVNALVCDIEEDFYMETKGVLQVLKDLKYVNYTEPDLYVISAEGWKHIAEMNKKDTSKQGFIAMSFREEARGISDTFKEAIIKCGYEPRRIDEKEFNNQIVPEMLYEIRRSRFVVVDITYPNYGAYYEAGYAEALGKEVIFCCRNDIFESKDKPHFDVAQKSIIIWKDEDELKRKLERRIEATVGKIY